MRTTNKNTPSRKSNGNNDLNREAQVQTRGKSLNTRPKSSGNQRKDEPDSRSTRAFKTSEGKRQKNTKAVFSSQTPEQSTGKKLNSAIESKPNLKPVTSRKSRQQNPACVAGEVFTWNQAGIICKRDAIMYSITKSNNEHSLFVEKNQFAYYIASNSWMLLLQDLSGDSLPEIARCILSDGLAPMITLANSLSNSLIEGTPLPSSPFGYFIRSATSKNTDDNILKILLQGLRYLKRFSPENTNSLISDELIGFQRRNTSMKLFDEVSIPMVHVLGLKHVLRDTFINWEQKLKRQEKQFDWFSSLPSNATADTGNTLTSKWEAVIQRIPFASQLCPPAKISVNTFNDSDFAQRLCKVSAIPKNYKARRIIASEECYRQTRMAVYSDTLVDCLNNKRGRYAPGGRVLIHDQSRNRQLARQGSIDNSLATIDCTAASDTVSWWLVREVFPRKLFTAMNSLRSTHYEIRDLETKIASKKVLYMFSSMGSRLTFPVETILFWGIACYACEIAAQLLGEKFDPNMISVYGDDTIVPSQYAEVVIHYLNMFGFLPNVEKSFYKDEGFRESCGIECYRGFDVSSKYFPRSTISDDVEGAIRLVSLQHRVFQHRLCSNFLCSILSDRFSVLYTTPGTKSSSLWVDYPSLSYKAISKRLYNNDIASWQFATENSDMSDYILETHVSTQYKTDTNPVTSELAEQLAYLAFLKYGPKYANEWDERNGISEKPTPRMAYATTSSVVLVRH